MKRNIETRVKRIKKKTAAKSKTKIKTSRKKTAATSTKQKREKRENRENREKVAFRSTNTVSQTLIISNDENNDDEFKNLDVSNNDENFNVSKNENEIEKNDWMN